MPFIYIDFPIKCVHRAKFYSLDHIPIREQRIMKETFGTFQSILYLTSEIPDLPLDNCKALTFLKWFPHIYTFLTQLLGEFN